jgi:hypothetical protein
MANGIEDLNTDFLPDGTGEGIIDILKQKAYEQVTNFMNKNNIPVTPDDTKKIVEDGLLQGDVRVILDVANERRKDLTGSAKTQIANELLSQAAMLTTPAGQLNAVNSVIQGGGDTAQIGLDLGQRGVEYLGDKVEDSKFDFLNIPSTALDLTGSGLELMDKGIEGIQSGSGAITRGANKIMDGVIYQPVGQVTDFLGRKIIDPLASKVDPFFNRFNRIRPVFKPKPPPPDSFNPMTAFTPDPRPDPRPVFTPPATSNEAEVDYGGSGGGSGGSYGGGEDFGSPFRPSRPSRPDLTKRANGGLVAVSRYLKGR